MYTHKKKQMNEPIRSCDLYDKMVCVVVFNVPLDTVQVISETGGPEQWCTSPIQ